MFSRFSPALVLALLALIGSAVVIGLLPRKSDQVITLTFTPQPGVTSPTVIDWNSIRQSCFGKPNGSTVSVTSTLSVYCVR